MVFQGRDGVICLGAQDNCATCKFIGGSAQKVCPLMEGVESGLFNINSEYESVHISNCDFYEPKAKHLKAVKKNGG